MSTENGNGHPGRLVAADQLPPHNLEAERSVLGAIFRDSSILEEIARIITPEDFWRAAHQTIFATMLGLLEAGKPADPVMIAEELKARCLWESIGADDCLIELASSVPHALNAKYHAAIVKQKSISRRVIESSEQNSRDAYSGLFTANQLADMARSRFALIEAPPDEPWPELLLDETPEAPPFPVDVFPVALERFCRGVASATLAAVDIPGVSMLATASAAIGQSVNISLKRTWYESPLLYLLIVADPGKSKTPPVKFVVRPLNLIDADLRDKSHDARTLWEAGRKAASKAGSVDPPPPQLRAVVKDITRETLVAILSQNPRGLLADPDEATGWVGSFNEYKGKGTDRQFWLDIWSSRPTSVDREGGNRSYYVPSPLVTVIGGIPPDMLGCLSEERGRNDGFLDRLLFSFPSEFPAQVWNDDELDQGDETAWQMVVEKLHRQPMFHDEKSNRPRPYRVELQRSAKAIWRDWYNQHCREMEDPEADPWIAGIYSKLRSYCARLALILSRLRIAMDPETDRELILDPVSTVDILGAIRLTEYFKGHAERVKMRQTGGLSNLDAQHILLWIRRKDLRIFREASIRENLRRRFPDLASLSPGLNALINAGVIRPKRELDGAPRRGPKPSRMFEVNPELQKRP